MEGILISSSVIIYKNLTFIRTLGQLKLLVNFYPVHTLKRKNKLVCEQKCIVHTNDFYLLFAAQLSN